MKYLDIYEGIFLNRENRFIANCIVDGVKKRVHVPNTGRCKELFIPEAKVLLEKSSNPNRKTEFSLVSVYKGKTLVNIDSQAPNKVLKEALLDGALFPDILPSSVKPEFTYGKSRIDFYFESKEKKYLMEVKGVTLEEDGIALFPDAPTERGIKHIEELIQAQKEGFETILFFLVQLKGVHLFLPNAKTHPAFAKTLQKAKENGVRIMAYDSVVTKNSVTIDEPVLVGDCIDS